MFKRNDRKLVCFAGAYGQVNFQTLGYGVGNYYYSADIEKAIQDWHQVLSRGHRSTS